MISSINKSPFYNSIPKFKYLLSKNPIVAQRSPHDMWRSSTYYTPWRMWKYKCIWPTLYLRLLCWKWPPNIIDHKIKMSNYMQEIELEEAHDL